MYEVVVVVHSSVKQFNALVGVVDGGDGIGGDGDVGIHGGD
jgi:hypothetical protein